MLKVKKLHPDAKLPTVAHFGDLAYDLYALKDTILLRGVVTRVSTGIAAQSTHKQLSKVSYNSLSDPEIDYLDHIDGLLIRDRSSMAAKGILISGGVIDFGYTGEISVVVTSTGLDYRISAGDKIAQMIPVPILTGEVVEVEELNESSRGDAGFGSTGR